MIELSSQHVRALRLRAQRLHPRAPRETLIEAVRAVVAVNAQSIPAMQLALRARVEGLTVEDVEQAISAKRSLVRTWLMRGTLHLAASEDVRWLVGLLGPVFAAKGKQRRLDLGLDDAAAARGVEAIGAILGRDGPLTRGELVTKLNEQGFALDRKSQGPIHLIGLAALLGLVCYGADREDGEVTFALLDGWIEPQEARPREAALADLARRYMQGYRPATLRDFAAWSGLGMADARAGWEAISGEGEWIEAQAGDQTLRAAASELGGAADQPDTGPVVRLLPAFDTLALGYSNRELIVRAEYQPEVFHGGQTVPVVLVDGQAAGVWRSKHVGKRLEITVRAFDAFGPEVWAGIAEEAEDIGRLWGMHVSVRDT